MTAAQAWREMLDADQALFAATTPEERLAARLLSALKRDQFVRVLGG